MATNTLTSSEEEVDRQEGWSRLFETLLWINTKYTECLEQKGMVTRYDEPMNNIELHSSITNFPDINIGIEHMIVKCPRFIYLYELDVDIISYIVFESTISDLEDDEIASKSRCLLSKFNAENKRKEMEIQMIFDHWHRKYANYVAMDINLIAMIAHFKGLMVFDKQMMIISLQRYENVTSYIA
eukprot:393278_1